MSEHRRFILKVFLCFFAIYLATWGAHYTSGDGAHKIAWSKAMLAGEHAIDPATHQAWSMYGVGHSLVAAVPLGVGRLLQRISGLHLEPVLYTLMFVVQSAVFLALVAAYLLPSHQPKQVWTVLWLMGVGSFWWPYSKLDFSEPLVLTFLFAGFVLVKRGRIFWGILVAALAGTFRTDAFVLVMLLGLYALARNRSLRCALTIAAGALPAVLVWAAGNFVRYGTIFDIGYQAFPFSTPLLVGLYGILFSAGKSVFLFAPPLILGIFGWRRFRQREQADAVFFLACFVAELLIYAKWWDWSGDDSWGVRFMIPGVMMMTIPAVEILQRRAAVLALLIAGIIVQLPGVLISPLEYVVLVHQQALLRKSVYVQGTSRVDFDDVRFNPAYSQLAGQYALLGNKLRPPTASRGLSLREQLKDAAPDWDVIWLHLRRSATAGPHEGR